MGISNRLLGKKNVNGKPHIESVSPAAALPGGEIRINGSSLRPAELKRPRVQFGEVEGAVVISSDEFVVARVPDGATSGPVIVATNAHVSNAQLVKVAVPIADNLHPVTNPAIDAEGNIYVTFSGSRGQQVPVSLFKIDTNYTVKPFLSDMMNATSIAIDPEGQVYVSSRHDGTVYRVAQNGTMSSYAEGMGVATGIAFDREQNLYVGDRSGTIFKISRDRQTFVFATLEPSVSAYHLAFSPSGNLFVTGPTTSSFDAVYRIDVDAYAIENLVMSGIFPLATSIISLTVMFVILLRMNVTIALLSLTVVPFMYLCLRYYTRTPVRLKEHKGRSAPVLTQPQRILQQQRTTLPPDPACVFSWKSAMSLEERERFHIVAGHLLSDLGYEV